MPQLTLSYFPDPDVISQFYTDIKKFNISIISIDSNSPFDTSYTIKSNYHTLCQFIIISKYCDSYDKFDFDTYKQILSNII